MTWEYVWDEMHVWDSSSCPSSVKGRSWQDTSGLTCVAVDTVTRSADVAKDNVGVTWQVKTHSRPAPRGAEL